MKTYLVFQKFGEVARFEATSMRATSKSIRFFDGKNLIAVFDFSEVRKAGEAKIFPEQKKTNSDFLSVERLNDFLAGMPEKSSN